MQVYCDLSVWNLMKFVVNKINTTQFSKERIEDQ